MSYHDWKQQGSRTRWKHTLGRWAIWVEESASWHLERSAHYGLDAHHAPRYQMVDITLSLGRYELHLFRDQHTQRRAQSTTACP